MVSFLRVYPLMSSAYLPPRYVPHHPNHIQLAVHIMQLLITQATYSTQCTQPASRLSNITTVTTGQITIYSENAVWPPEDGRKDARNLLRNNWLTIKSLIIASGWSHVYLLILYIIDLNLWLDISSLPGYYVSTGEFHPTFLWNLIPYTRSVYFLWASDSGDESQTFLRNSVNLFSVLPEKFSIAFRLGYHRFSGTFAWSLKAPINLVMSVHLSIRISSIGEAAAGWISIKFDVGEFYENLLMNSELG